MARFIGSSRLRIRHEIVEDAEADRYMRRGADKVCTVAAAERRGRRAGDDDRVVAQLLAIIPEAIDVPGRTLAIGNGHTRHLDGIAAAQAEIDAVDGLAGGAAFDQPCQLLFWRGAG